MKPEAPVHVEAGVAFFLYAGWFFVQLTRTNHATNWLRGPSGLFLLLALLYQPLFTTSLAGL